jgi:hypothetical protein
MPHCVRYMPVVDDGHLVGLISLRGLWRHVPDGSAHPAHDPACDRSPILDRRNEARR